MKPTEINDILEIPVETKYVSIKPEEASFLYDFVKDNHLEKTLETGLGYGSSATHILAAHGKEHIAIDPYQKDYDYLALKNIEAAGYKEKFEFFEDHSHNVLPYLVKEGKKFDFIFVDGDHKFDGILVDFYYADLLLKMNGFILFHDTWMRSTQLVGSFIRKNKANYVEIPSAMRNYMIFKKQFGEDDRDGMHFKEFYTRRSQFKFALISWMLRPGNSLLKKMAIRMKNILK